MLNFIDPDPTQALLKVALAVVLVTAGIALSFRLVDRVRQHGGGLLASSVTVAAVAGLLVSIYPELIAFDIGLVVLIVSLVAIYRPTEVVKATGGPRLEWRALREGRELQLLVTQRGSPSMAQRNPEIMDRFEALAAFEGPGTTDYLGCLREALFVDPAAPDTRGRLASLAAADQALRARLGTKPTWEREMQRRALADPGLTDADVDQVDENVSGR